MKRTFKMKMLSFALAVLASVMLFPYGTLTAYAVNEVTEADENLVNEPLIEENDTATAMEPENSTSVPVEEETEIFYDEYEIDNTAMSAPPMTQIGGAAEPNALTVLPDGVYEIENVGNIDFYIAVEGDYAVEGYKLLQKSYSTATPLTSFARTSLFKISRVGNTDRYIIRSMLNNRMSLGVSSGKIVTKYIDTDDSQVPASDTFTITYSSGSYIIRPYGSTGAIYAPNSSASGDAGAPNSYLSIVTESSIGSRGKWNFTQYTGDAKYGIIRTQTAGMSKGLAKNSSGTIWIKSWSTVIGANTPHIAVVTGYENIATSTWTQSTFSTRVTGHKCNDFMIIGEIRTGSSQTSVYTETYKYTIVPDVAGVNAYIQNIETGKYVEVESASTAEGGIIQQWKYHVQLQNQWIFESVENGYFKIKSARSQKYLSLDEESPTSIKQYSEVTDRSLWKIVETTTGHLKLICKAEESLNQVLSSLTGNAQDGEDLRLLGYLDNSDYRDEWKIIAFPIDVSLIALPETYDRSSYFEEIVYSLKGIGYKRTYDNHAVITNVSDSQPVMLKAELLKYMSNSKITMIRTHGNKTGISASNGMLTVSDLSALSSDYLSYSDLIIYGACKTASGGSNDAGNLVNATVSAGARSAIGFVYSVSASACNTWCKYFFEYYATYYNMSQKTLYDVCIDTGRRTEQENQYYEYTASDGNLVSLRYYVIAGDDTIPG